MKRDGGGVWGGGGGRLSVFRKGKQRDIAVHGAYMHVIGVLKAKP